MVERVVLSVYFLILPPRGGHQPSSIYLPKPGTFGFGALVFNAFAENHATASPRGNRCGSRRRGGP